MLTYVIVAGILVFVCWYIYRTVTNSDKQPNECFDCGHRVDPYQAKHWHVDLSKEKRWPLCDRCHAERREAARHTA